MTDAPSYRQNRPLNPVHAILLGFPTPLFGAVLLNDVGGRSGGGGEGGGLALGLLVGGVLAGGIVLGWVLVGLVRAGAGRLPRSIVYAVVLFGMCSVGLVNAVARAKGAWTGTPQGIGLSAVACGLALMAAWTGYLGVPRQTDR